MRINEKKMLMQAISTVVVIVMCLAAMTISAYAFFSHSITSSFYPVRTANFETNVAIQIIDENGVVAESVVPSNQKLHEVLLEANKTYTVVITPTTNSTAKTGFVIVTATGCKEVYHTKQLGIDASVEGGYTQDIKFDIAVTLDTTVQFLSHWGTSSYYWGTSTSSVSADGENDLYITGEKLITMVIDETMGLEDELLPTPTPLPDVTPVPTGTPLPQVTATPVPDATVAPSMPPLESTEAPVVTPAPTTEPILTMSPTPEATSEPVATEEPKVSTEVITPEVPETPAEETASLQPAMPDVLTDENISVSSEEVIS